MTGISNPIQRIVGLFGGQTALARLIGRSQGTVWEWVEKGQVPSNRIPEVIAAGANLNPPVRLEPNDFFIIPPDHNSNVAAGAADQAAA